MLDTGRTPLEMANTRQAFDFYRSAWRFGLLRDIEALGRASEKARKAGNLDSATGEEIAHYGTESVQIPARLLAMLDDLEEASAPRYVPAIRRARALIEKPEETQEGPPGRGE